MPELMVQAADGRRLAVDTHGHIKGRPVFLLHGTPGSRVGPLPRASVLYRLGVRLISFDRPGYGDSSRLPGRRVSSAADDVTTIADALGLADFAVLGRSGGGPHALACAALLPHRVTRVSVLVSLAPRHAEGLDWYAGMTESNRRGYSEVERGLHRFADAFQVRSRKIKDDPVAVIKGLVPELPPTDRSVVADAGIRRMLLSTYREAFRYGAYGWIDDVLAFTSDWGFTVENITVPTRLWHGADDQFSPVQHSQWLADHIPGAELYLEPGAAHFGSLRVMAEELKWAAGPSC
ncbi:alpha/beta hydrolase [Kitasatospora sp. GP82]|uniref:alpha/beta fold hydrolase n=1 Tax=Kitasatospora sp. GP82 TaxID=3035089 RepID=UPI0024740821|nr:alpha/beta hydrolase [Kitasatospora sp. GP82]MDH6126213.1 pimeloyl-ACP methyl ester carboxylesterase [Kitasatospora sp. GP82]